MTFDEYQIEADKLAVYPGRGSAAGLSYCTLGLCGESGEVANRVKKLLRDNGGITSATERVVISKEVGDCLWYLSQVASELGYSLGDIASENLAKLVDRQARGVIGGSGDKR